MTRGTRSVLWGAHCFLVHPWFVAYAWWKLYGFPWDPRLWVCFFVHDVGYIGKTMMDDADGETHPEVGATIVRRLFGDTWGDFCLLHSRHYAKRLGRSPSRLCFADKMAFVHTPRWVYMVMVNWDELLEYLSRQRHFQSDPLVWHDKVVDHTLTWVAAHKDGAEDHETPLRHPEGLK